MKLSEIIQFLDNEFHPEYQEDYDNSGFLLGDPSVQCSGVLVALDLTEAVVTEAVNRGTNLIVTHHPFIFSGLKRLTDNNTSGRLVWKLIKNDMAVYAAHTNLDNLPWGINGVLCEKLGLRNARILRPQEPGTEIGAGMVGELKTMLACETFLRRVKSNLKLPMMRVSEHLPEKKVRRVAVCGGSGSDFIGDALAAKADVYITADLKYHDFQRTDGRMVLVDIGHYESEQFAKEIIFRAISEKFSNFACRISETQKGLVKYI